MNDTQIMETIHGCFEEMAVAINGRLDQMQTELKAGLHEELKRHEERLDRMDERMNSMETSLQSQIDKVDRKITVLALHVENETDKKIQILAENHLELMRKLNEGIEAANRNKMYAMEVDCLVGKVDKLYEDVEEIKKRVIRKPRRRISKAFS